MRLTQVQMMKNQTTTIKYSKQRPPRKTIKMNTQ
jgi:hypothetical protein